MKITLRRANTLQAAITEAMKAIKVSTTVDVNEYSSPAEKIANAAATAIANDATREALLDVLYKIREQVALANVTSGVTSSLTTAARIEKRIAQLADLVNAEPVAPFTEVMAKVEKMVAANATPNAYYRGVDTVTANVLSAEMILKYKQQLVTLKKAKQATNDAVLEFNIRTQIELDEGAVKLLTAQGLL